jgi:phage-related protein
MKPALIHPKARAVLRSFPEEVRREIGKSIFDLHKGAKLSVPCRPMPSVAAGVEELRIKDRSGAYRVFYFIKLETAVVILHAFQKKTSKTPSREIELARARLKEIL